jgi:quinol monooxygenase YgiN
MNRRPQYKPHKSSLIKVVSRQLTKDRDRNDRLMVVSVWTDDARDDVFEMYMTRRQLAQFCQQVDGIWIDEFMAREMGQ